MFVCFRMESRFLGRNLGAVDFESLLAVLSSPAAYIFMFVFKFLLLADDFSEFVGAAATFPSSDGSKKGHRGARKILRR